jgi:hypothetical protein
MNEGTFYYMLIGWAVIILLELGFFMVRHIRLVRKNYPSLFNAVERARKRGENLPHLPPVEAVENSISTAYPIAWKFFGWDYTMKTNQLVSEEYKRFKKIVTTNIWTMLVIFFILWGLGMYLFYHFSLAL